MNASQEQLPPEMLLTQAPFNSIFPIQTPVLQRIVDRMKKIGFDPAHPILVWKRLWGFGISRSFFGSLTTRGTPLTMRSASRLNGGI